MQGHVLFLTVFKYVVTETMLLVLCDVIYDVINKHRTKYVRRYKQFQLVVLCV